MRKHRPFADGSGNAPYRPFAALQDRPHERAGSARKRSSAEDVGFAKAAQPMVEFGPTINAL